MKKSILILFLGLFTANLYSQNKVLDSLNLRLSNSLSAEDSAWAHMRIAWNSLRINPDESIRHGNISAKTYAELGDSINLIRSEYYIGLAYRLKSEYGEALPRLEKAYNYFVSIGNIRASSGPLFNIAVVHSLLGDYEKSMAMYYKELKINEENKSIRGIANSYNSIGIIHKKLEQYDLAISFYNKSLAMLDTLNTDNDTYEKANLHSNLASLYLEKNELDSAMSEILIAMELHKEIDHDMGVGDAFYMLGVIFQKRNEFTTSIDYFERAIKLYQLQDHKKELVFTKIEWSRSLLLMKDYDSALNIAKEALLSGEELHVMQNVKDLYRLLAEIYRAKQEYKMADLYQERFSNLSDSLLSEKALEQINHLQIRYDTKEKQDEIISLEKENEMQTEINNNQRMLMFGGIGLLLLLIAFLIAITKQISTKKKLAEQNLEIKKIEIDSLQKQGQLDVLNAVLDGEEKERMRVSRDLHDGLGSMLTTLKLTMSEGKGDNNAKGLKLINKTHEEVRRIAHDLMPASLIRFGLKNSLEDLCRNINNANGPNCQLSIIGIETRLAQHVELNIYRICQEAITNAIKYANANTLIIQIQRNENHLVIEIEDDGIGFEMGAKKDGIGLKNMHLRVEQLGGDISIQSKVGEGTQLYVEIDLENKST
jgi:signal transduction histidine kinase